MNSTFVRERFHSGVVALLLIVVNLLVAVCAPAKTTNTLSDAEIQGRQLAQQLLEQRPAENFTNTGILQIRYGDGMRIGISVEFQTIVTTTNWLTVYQTTSEGYRVKLVVVHSDKQPSRYQFCEHDLAENEIMTPFAGSDFWIADLGLEFFHWPEQKVLKKEFRRNCSCVVLESANPNPATNGYSRVDSWIDEESGGIVMARAYDAQGKLLKEFYPKDVKKVKGQWQVESMELDNVQTGSRTRLEFDLKQE